MEYAGHYPADANSRETDVAERQCLDGPRLVAAQGGQPQNDHDPAHHRAVAGADQQVAAGMEVDDYDGPTQASGSERPPQDAIRWNGIHNAPDAKTVNSGQVATRSAGLATGRNGAAVDAPALERICYVQYV